MTTTIRIVELNAPGAYRTVNGHRLETDAPLAGSDKQVAWATEIRATVVETALRRRIGAHNTIGADLWAAYEADMATIAAGLDILLRTGALATARLWIDRRGDDLVTIVRHGLAGLKPTDMPAADAPIVQAALRVLSTPVA